MSKLPTAQEFLNNNNYWYSEDYEILLVKFAKLHCTEQARVISENVKLLEVSQAFFDGQSRMYNSAADDFKIDKNSILNSYDLDNIK